MPPAPRAQLVTDVFPVASYEGGPPFAMSLALLTKLLTPHGFRALSTVEVPAAQRARPAFRGAGEWLVRWVRKEGGARAEDADEELNMF